MLEYTADTTNASDTVTAVASDEDATVEIELGAVPISSGDAATWSEGENALTITVTNGEETTTYTVTVTYTVPPDTTLSALSIGQATLTPTFDKDVTTYTATTSNATNTITATATDTNATITILLGETPIENGTAATWATGENALTITVANGGESTVYTVTVTKE